MVRRIDSTVNLLPAEAQNLPTQSLNETTGELPPHEQVAPGDRALPDFRVEMRRFALQQQVAPATAQTGSAVNNLRAGESIPIHIEANDTQSDVLRRAYTEYALRAGLTSSGQAQFVEQMMRTGGETINHAGTNQPFTDEEFAAKRAEGTINMVPSEEQVAYLRQLKVEELLSYGLTDWAVTEGEERQVVDILRSDPNLSQMVRGLNESDYLGALIDRVDETQNRRELITLLGSRLDAETARLVEPHIENIDNTMIADPGAVAPSGQVNTNVWQVRFNLARMGVTGSASDFDRVVYRDLSSGSPRVPFSGVGATGVNPSTAAEDVPTTDIIMYGIHRDVYPAFPETYAHYNNPGMSLGSPEERRRQVELFTQQPISTTMPELYGGQLPSRADVISAAATRYNLEPELVAAVMLAEQRDQSQLEDGKDYAAATRLGGDTSIGLGQIKISTARNQALFGDLMSERTQQNLTHGDRARLLASDEVNIFATARYIRYIANMGASPELRAREAGRSIYNRPPVQDLSRTQRALPNLNLSAYARHSSEWTGDNIRMLGSEYTSYPWDNDLHLRSERLTREEGADLGSYNWGDFVFDAYRDVKSSGVFRR